MLNNKYLNKTIKSKIEKLRMKKESDENENIKKACTLSPKLFKNFYNIRGKDILERTKFFLEAKKESNFK